MYWAMVALTCVMVAALALQFGGWLWIVSPRLLVVIVAIALLLAGVWMIWGQKIRMVVGKGFLKTGVSQQKKQ